MYMKMVDKDREGLVLRIERGSTNDGDGFRTVVFLKGCPLRCAWCSTPESHSFQIQKTADNTYGTIMTVEEVLKEVRKDSLFYFISSGGLTLSGGEILAQPDFTRAILQNARKELMNTAIETSFYAQWDVIASILPYVHLAHVDLKIFDNELHKKYTGVDNAIIKENLLKTNELDDDFKIVLRTPVIPGINNTEEELSAIGKFASQLDHLAHVELLPYHRYGTATYEKLGLNYTLSDVKVPTKKEMSGYRKIVGQYVQKVI